MLEKFKDELVHLELELDELHGERFLYTLDLPSNLLLKKNQILADMVQMPSSFIIYCGNLSLQ